jgi:hypothetical protein
MRPNLHLPVLGQAIRLGVTQCQCWHGILSQSFVRPCTEAVLRHIDLLGELADSNPKLPCDSHGLRFWPSKVPPGPT